MKRDADKTKNQLIVELKEMRQQLAELKAKEPDKLRTEPLPNTSHELRTSLASIKGFTTMLLDYDKKLKHDEKREFLETIDKNADQLAKLIEKLLEQNLDRK